MSGKRRSNERRPDLMYEKSFSERGRISQKNREVILRARIMLAVTVVALAVIVTLLIVKLVNVGKDKQNNNESKQVIQTMATQKPEADKKEDTDNKKDNEKDTKTKTGTKMWFRDDLDPDKPMVALTFDDGPYTKVTERIIKTLEENDAKATFFVVGNRVPAYKDILKKTYEQGNQIATHTYSHSYLTKVSKKEIRSELKKSREILQETIGCHFTGLRPPGGMVNDTVRETVKVPMYNWSIDTEDWKSRNVKSILTRCKSISDGDIVLMHDLYPTTADAVEKLVPRLKRQGYQLVTIDELMYYKGINAEAGKLYFSGK